MKIYFDMDGVLADFNSEKNGLERFRVEKNFFYKLKPIKRNVRFIKKLIKKGFDVNIISASPNVSADTSKILWLTKHIPELNVNKVKMCRNHHNKAEYVGNIKGAILIDDYTQNLVEWRKKGGKVIKFVNNYDSVKGLHKKKNIPYTKRLTKLKLKRL